MSQAALKTTSATPSAIENLAAMLADDMRGVNAMILRQLGSQVPLIPQIAQYLIAAGGKRLRPLLCVAAARLTGDTSDHSHALAAAVEFIHSASLLHDDVVDESAQRRGQPSANETFGNQASVLVGDFLFARAFEFMVSTGNLEILQVLATSSTKITEGEVLQMTLAGDINTREEDYLRVIESKTASLFSAATETGAILGDSALKQRSGSAKNMREAMRDFGHHLGMAFQMIDDALDYTADAEKLNKNLGDDFREGKLTLPVILAIQAANADERAFWQSVLGNPEQDEKLFIRAQELIQKHNVMPQVRARAESYGNQARTALMQLPDAPIRAQLLGVIDDVISREG